MAARRRVLVVGAGMAGLTAARVLVDGGLDVVVVDKGRAVGGRMASRRVRPSGDGPVARFDTGAQFLTAKTAEFARAVDGWIDRGVAATWFHGGPDGSSAATDDAVPAPRPGSGDGHPRHRGVDAMRAIPEALAADLAGRVEVRLGARVTWLRADDRGWSAGIGADDGAPAEDLRADAVVLTAPSPQAVALLEAGSGVPVDLRAALGAITWNPAWAVLVRPEGPVHLPGPAGDVGALRLADHPVEWVTDNLRKGVSAAPAVTLHASAARTRELLDASPEEAGAAILADARDLVTGTVVHAHRWRYSAPATTWHEPAVLATDPAPIVLAGDAYAGGRVEGAWTSGRAAGEALLRRLDPDRPRGSDRP